MGANRQSRPISLNSVKAISIRPGNLRHLHPEQFVGLRARVKACFRINALLLALPLLRFAVWRQRMFSRIHARLERNHQLFDLFIASPDRLLIFGPERRRTGLLIPWPEAEMNWRPYPRTRCPVRLRQWSKAGHASSPVVSRFVGIASTLTTGAEAWASCRSDKPEHSGCLSPRCSGLQLPSSDF
jgi:hypothetical protein